MEGARTVWPLRSFAFPSLLLLTFTKPPTPSSNKLPFPWKRTEWGLATAYSFPCQMDPCFFDFWWPRQTRKAKEFHCSGRCSMWTEWSEIDPLRKVNHSHHSWFDFFLGIISLWLSKESLHFCPFLVVNWLQKSPPLFTFRWIHILCSEVSDLLPSVGALGWNKGHSKSLYVKNGRTNFSKQEFKSKMKKAIKEMCYEEEG